MKAIRSMTAITLAAALVQPTFAKLEVSKIFSDNMVLQREKALPVWGKAEPGETVTVAFAGQSRSGVANVNGLWTVTLAPLAVSAENREMTVSGAKETVAFKDVLVGDVWLCSGQSNMEMSFQWGVYEGDRFKEEAKGIDAIRHVKIARVRSPLPSRFNVPTSGWEKPSGRGGIVNWTACGWFFARKVQAETGVPIGIVDDNWSGCKIEPFISPSGLEDPSVKLPNAAKLAELVREVDPATEKGKAAFEAVLAEFERWIADNRARLDAGDDLNTNVPTLPSGGIFAVQYNAMIAPITRFPIKGAIWYQGCSNGGEDESYLQKLQALVAGWRKEWGYEFPFYWVQLASYLKGSGVPGGTLRGSYAPTRDAMRRALDVIPRGGMAVTIDIGNPTDIHPKCKLFVGERLALWALRQDYGKDIVCSGPLFKALSVKDGKAVVSFDFVGGGLCTAKKNYADNSPVEFTPGEKVRGFAVAGADRKWFWATAEIVGKTVVVSASEVPEPVAVRYAFDQNPMENFNLYNKAGLPASPFRTDDWQ